MQYTSVIKKFSPHLDRFDIDLLISHVTKKPREFFIAHNQYSFSLLEYARLILAIRKRKNGLSIAYITGEKDFYGLTYGVNKHTLVPRPDTEIMVECAIKKINEYTHVTLIDVGTGSGCIPIAIAKANPKNIDRIIAIDISRGAVSQAKKNAKKHDAPITFLHGNLLEPFLAHEKNRNKHEQFIITANLPYLTEQQFIEEPSIQKEPKSALVALDGGLALYKELLLQLHHSPFTQDVTGFFEIDPSQSTSLTKAIHDIFPIATIHIEKDLSGSDRCLVWKI